MQREKETRAFETDLEIRGTDGRNVFGRAAPYGEEIEYAGLRETIMPGAFARSLSQRGIESVKFVAFHNANDPVGVAVDLRETTQGLDAEFRVAKTARGDEILELIASKAIGGLSVGMTVMAEGFKSGVRQIREAALWEVSAVTFPAYAGAKIAAVRAQEEQIQRARAEIFAAARFKN